VTATTASATPGFTATAVAPVAVAPVAVAAASRVVHLPPGGDLAGLLRGCPVALVYSRAEQRYCALRQDLTGWGGRLAAKLAVADLLGIDADGALATGRDVGLPLIEIVPAPSVPCPDGAGCTKPHPPDVRFRFDGSEGFGITRREDESVKVSISHTQAMAIALAVCVNSVIAATGRTVAQP
jgi:hypothetical protein